MLGVIDNQVRSLRKRQVVGSYTGGLRRGTYWGIRSDVAHYGLADALEAPHGQTMRLAETPTRLKALDDADQERLINWGYAICDTALRRWVRTDLTRPDGLPHSDMGVGDSTRA